MQTDISRKIVSSWPQSTRWVIYQMAAFECIFARAPIHTTSAAGKSACIHKIEAIWYSDYSTAAAERGMVRPMQEGTERAVSNEMIV